MGQYYKPIVLDADGKILKAMYSWEFNFGLKLMEHSWMNSEFVQVFETLLVMDGPVRVVWAGDYADPELDENGKILKEIHEGREYDVTLYDLVEDHHYYRPDTPAYGRKSHYQWYNRDGSRRDSPKITWTTEREVPPNAPVPSVLPTMSSYPWLVNHDKGLVVDKRKVPKDSGGWRIHPLPLLTVEGNGRGGGDFREDREGNQGNFKLIGSWARDRISLSKTLPKGFTKLDFNIVEG